MNWEKKTIESYKSELNKGGCFTSLWCVIANSYQFYKIPINISDEKYVQIKLKIKYSSNEMNINFDEDILNQIEKYYKEKLMKNNYFTNDINLQIIHIEKNYVILSDKNFEYGNIYATQDNLYPNRYFIGFKYNNISMNYVICGIIVYFDSFGEMKRKNIFNNILCYYDLRNGNINSTKTVLYNRTLMFYQIHRDSKNLISFVNLLNWEDNIIEINTFYDTNITSLQYVEFKDMTKELVDKNNLNPRFFYFKTHNYSYVYSNNNNLNEEKHIFIDLDSLDCVECYEKNNIFTNILTSKKKEFIKLDYYVLNSLDYINSFISDSSKFENKELVPEYPIFCPKCSKLTSKATHILEQNTLCGLGDSFCFDCKIRYSISGNSWLCCFLNTEIEEEKNYYYDILCCSKLNKSNGFFCLCENKHTSKYKLTISSTEESYMYPFKKTITLVNEKI